MGSTDFLFHFSALSVLPFWGMMIFLPRSERTERIVRSSWIILPPVVCYTGLLIPNLSWEMTAFFSAPSAAGLARIMAEPWAAALFWAYAGAFDLFVGRWIFLDSRKRGIPHLLVAPILAVAILFGPVGFLLYALAAGGRKLFRA